MIKTELRAATQTATQVQQNRPVIENARQRVLDGLPVTERRLQLAGVSTAVLEGGDGPPIVLLHGPGEYGAKWMRVIPDLVKTHRVIAPDLPGHGNTTVTDGTINAEHVLAWLDELIDETCSSPPTLVGHILGGAIAARFAGDRSRHLDRLILVDSLGLGAFQPTPEFGSALMNFIGQPTEDTHDRLWQQCAFDLDDLREQMGERWEALRGYNLDRARVLSSQVTQHSLMEQFGIPAIPQLVLARISVPTTLIWGRHDLATPLRVAETASQLYGWPLRVIEHAADDPTLEQPEAFTKALRDALDSRETLDTGSKQ